ncbi:MAG: hypothetical protein O2869_03045 [Bacteroidetes bacterium]|nr:hypothetical protein [Bacteroidota bacterium]
MVIGLTSRLYQKIGLKSSGTLKKSYQKRIKNFLKETEDYASKGQIEEFYEALSKTLDHALSLLLKETIRGASDGQIKSVLGKVALESSAVEEIAALMNKVNLIKYSPISSSDVESDLERLHKLIQLIQAKAKAL